MKKQTVINIPDVLLKYFMWKYQQHPQTCLHFIKTDGFLMAQPFHEEQWRRCKSNRRRRVSVLTINIRACCSVPAEPLPLNEWSLSETQWPFSFHLSFPRTEQLSADLRLLRKGPPLHVALVLSPVLLLEPIGAAVPVHVCQQEVVWLPTYADATG